MSIFNVFKLFSKKNKPEPIDEIPYDEIYDEENIIDVISQEESIDEVVDLPIEETTVEPVVEEEVVEPTLEEEILEEVKEEEWIPMEQVMDTLKSKYQSYDLTSFLDFDYEKEGQKDGYHIHSSEFLKKKKQNLIAEFQRLIEKRVDELKDERLNCKNLVIDMRGLSDQLIEKFQLRIDLCNEYIEDLHNEKSLSNSGTGLIRSVLTDYEVGWDKGMSDYLMDNHFLNPLKRL